MPSDQLLARLLPEPVSCAENLGDPPEPAGLPVERAAIAHAVASRRRDYLGVRDCARTALDALGMDPVAIGTGPKREPRWPAGVVGSLTHCAGYQGAAVAPAHRLHSLGIDAEPHDALPPGVFDAVTVPEERTALAGLGTGAHWDRLLFCAKEAVYKAWFPLTGEWLGFEEACVAIDPVQGRFRARLLRPGPVVGGTALQTFQGRWLVSAGLVLAAVLVPVEAESG